MLIREEPMSNAPLPSDHRSSLAAYMQKYLAGEIDRTEVAKQMDEFWKTH